MNPSLSRGGLVEVVKQRTEESVVRLGEVKQCVGTECPGGCCPEVGWYCCPDQVYCAATADDCPFLAQAGIESSN